MKEPPQRNHAAEAALRRQIDFIERAFRDVAYPGDDRISVGSDLDAIELRELFKAKHWSVVPLSAVRSERGSLSFFTPEAFRFYLPAFLRAVLLYPQETDTLRENLFYTLTPPESEGESMSWFRELAEGLTVPQREVIRSFVKSFAESEPYYSKAIRDRALKYWFGQPPATQSL